MRITDQPGDMPNKKPKNDTVKKEIMLLAVFISLAVGFIAGVVFGVYKSRASLPIQTPMPPPQSFGGQSFTPPSTEMILSLEKDALNDPQNAEAWARLGNAYFDVNAYEKAIQAYTTSLELNPDDPDILTDLGIMHRRSGDSSKALASFEKAVAIDPLHQQARFNKGVVLLHDLNDPKGALDAWKKLVEVNPEATTATGQLVKELIQKVSSSR